MGLPDARGAYVQNRTKLQFDFSVRPTRLSRIYRCRLELSRHACEPVAYVLCPDLEKLANGERPPHIYAYDAGRTRLCLFFPDSNEWTPKSWLDETFVPWTISWLRFYEIWLATGVWDGGGEHPATEHADTPRRRRYGMAGRRQ
jgi:hypothetical protein